MKTFINYMVTVLLTLMSLHTYYSFMVYIFIYHILGKLTFDYQLVMKWNGILSPIIAVILAILTGSIYNLLRIKGFKKTRIVLVIVQFVCFIYSVLKVLEVYKHI